MNADACTLSVTRLIRAPRHAVWDGWMDASKLEKWWCPKPWRAEITGFRPEPGGAFNFVLHGPEGEKHAVAGAFLVVEEAARIVFTTALLEGFQPTTPGLSFSAIITLADENGGTRYTAMAVHPDVAETERHREMGFVEGWGACIAQLAELVE